MKNVTFTHQGKIYSMTEDAIEAAYEYQKKQYLLSDAEDHLRALCFGWERKDEYVPGKEMKDDDQREKLMDFETAYGISFDEALRHLEAYVARYQSSFSQELTEDDQWDCAICQVLNHIQKNAAGEAAEV